MLRSSDNLTLSLDALRSHKLRAALTILGLTMGVATLITVVTIIQGANLYVETKIATLGSDTFQLARTPFATTDWTLLIKSQKFRRIFLDDYEAFRQSCSYCRIIGAQGSMRTKARLGNIEVTDVDFAGQTPSMVDIETRELVAGRYFTESENNRALRVCLIGQGLREKLFSGQEPLGQTFRLASQEFIVVGVFEKVGSILGQDADNFAVALARDPSRELAAVQSPGFKLEPGSYIVRAGKRWKRIDV